MGNILESAHALNKTIIQWYRDLHQIPEVGLHLPLTRDYVCKRLEELGIPYETFAEHSGICATDEKRATTALLRTALFSAEIVQSPLTRAR